MWPALLPFPLHSKWKIRRSISKVGTQKDSWTSTEPCPYASPPLSLRRPVALQLHTAWYDSEEKGVFPDPFLICWCVYICMCAYRTSLTNAFTATETKHQLLISRTWACKLLFKSRKMMKFTCNFFSLFWWGKRQRFSCSYPKVPAPRHLGDNTKYFFKNHVCVCVHAPHVLISHSRKWSYLWMHFTKAQGAMQRWMNSSPSALGSAASWVRE